MKDIQEFQEDHVYSKETKYAVRYGYLYRKEAEEYGCGQIHACLEDASEILLWIAESVIGGVIYDIIKSAVKKLYQNIIIRKKKIDKTTEVILTDESKLEEFCNYIKEFQEHRITANSKQIRYIREEIIADYTSKEFSVICEKEKRYSTIEENKEIIHNAFMLADELVEEKGGD